MPNRTPSIDALIATFVEKQQAREKAEREGRSASEVNRYEASGWQAQEKLFSIYGDEGREALSVLLDHDDRVVRCGAAVVLLRFKHQKAMEVLQELANGDLRDNCWLGANLTIQRWHDGEWTLDPDPALVAVNEARVEQLRNAPDREQRIQRLLDNFVFHCQEKKREMVAPGYGYSTWSVAHKQNERHWREMQATCDDLTSVYQGEGWDSLCTLLDHSDPDVCLSAAFQFCDAKLYPPEVVQTLERLAKSDIEEIATQSARLLAAANKANQKRGQKS